MGFTRRTFTRPTMIGLILLAAATPPVHVAAQTLSKRGWAGSGMTVAPWWQSAILYQVDPVSFQDSKGDGFGDLHGILERFDYLQALGVDALVLSPLQSNAARANAVQPFDTSYGTPEDLDQLIVEGGRRKIRILVDLSLGGAHTTQATINIARFWLTHGVAGLRLTLDTADPLSPAQLADRLRELKRLSATFAGDRILFWNAAQPSSDNSNAHSRRTTASTADSTQLSLNTALELLPHLDATSLRHALASLPAPRAGHTTVIATDAIDLARSFDRYGSGSGDVELAKALATALLTGPGSPQLYFGQELGMATTPAPAPGHAGPGDPTPMQWGDARGFTSGVPWIDMGRNASTANVAMEDVDRYSLLNWYRRLTALHHANAVLREGSADLLDLSTPGVVAWVRRTTSGSPVVVVCNLSARPVALSIAPELHRLNVATGTGVMHTLAASNAPGPSTDTATDPTYDAPISVNQVSLPPYGIYVGELRGQAGLETMPSPARSHRRSKSGK